MSSTLAFAAGSSERCWPASLRAAKAAGEVEKQQQWTMLSPLRRTTGCNGSQTTVAGVVEVAAGRPQRTQLAAVALGVVQVAIQAGTNTAEVLS